MHYTEQKINTKIKILTNKIIYLNTKIIQNHENAIVYISFDESLYV